MTEEVRDAALKALHDLVQKFIVETNYELRGLWNALPIDVPEKELYEVIGALLSRQSLLLRQMAFSKEFWNHDGGSIILRAMVDTHITLAYICQEDSFQRALTFIDYGLGQERLHISKIKARAEAEGDKDGVKKLEAYEKHLDSEKYIHHTDVNLGSWLSKSIRSLATDVGLGDLYDGTFPTLSAGTHGMWNHLLKFNCTTSDNPLHADMKIPKTEHPRPDFQVLLLAAGQVEMSFTLVRKRFNIAQPDSNPAQRLDEGMDVLTTRFNESPTPG